MANIDQAADIIDTDRTEILELVEMGVIARKSDGTYDLEEVLRNYIQFMRKVIAGHAPDTPTALKRMAVGPKQ